MAMVIAMMEVVYTRDMEGATYVHIYKTHVGSCEGLAYVGVY